LELCKAWAPAVVVATIATEIDFDPTRRPKSGLPGTTTLVST
jgi:hypothetical protein